MFINRIKLLILKVRARPSAQFKSNLWRELGKRTETDNEVVKGWLRLVLWRGLAVSITVFLVVVFLGTGVYAYTSPEVTEGSLLYPLKINLEKIESVAKRTPEAKAKFYLKTIERREAERKVLEKRGQAIEVIERKIEQTGERLQTINEEIDEAKKEGAEIKPRVEKRLEERKQRLEKRATSTERLLNKLEDNREEQLIRIETKKEKKNERVLEQERPVRESATSASNVEGKKDRK